MLGKVNKTLVKVFGSRNERLVKAYMTIAQQSNDLEEQTKQLSDEALKAKTSQFKEAIKSGASPEDILSEAFAVVREAARRNVEMRHFDVQLIGGNVLYEGKIAEMATGEGKTLVATLAAYMVSLTGRKVHIITVNDYLAKRDAEWMRPVYEALGLTVGAIQADMDTAGEERKNQYACDITYGTNNEFGFDYLRDNMKISLERMVQGPLQYAIIDEVDSILIDEARTPLIISGPSSDEEAVMKYVEANRVAKKLISLQVKEDGPIKKKIDYDEIEAPTFQEKYIPSIFDDISTARGTDLVEAEKRSGEITNEITLKEKQLYVAIQNKDINKIEELKEKIEQLKGELNRQAQRIEDIQKQAMLTGAQVTSFFEIDYKSKSAHLTERGVAIAQTLARVGSFYTGSNMEWPHLLEQSLRAHLIYEKEKDYIVQNGQIIIVDEFTGRLMHGRQWSDGLHQAVEAKEKVRIKKETQTLATITLQNFFKLYDQIAGMTGTAATEAEEFLNIYKLEVVVIPTNKPCIRDDQEDVIYKTKNEKHNAIVEEIFQISNSGRPILVGTTSVEKNLEISQLLKKRYGKEYPHEILNAKEHKKEAYIVTQAGQQHKGRSGNMLGNVTITTNMAGRGTDIKLGSGIAQIGGLHVVGTERHESRRIDNQLRGRCARQGDSGSSVFFISFEDDLMRIFAPEWTVKALSWIGWEEGQPIYHKRISKGIEKAQKKVEWRNFEIRKSLLEYDEVMDYQRKIFYSRRREILSGKGLKNIVQQMISSTITRNCNDILDKTYPLTCIIEWARLNHDVDLKIGDVRYATAEDIEYLIKKKAKEKAINDIELSVGEYLEVYSDAEGGKGRGSRDLSGLCKWADNVYKANLITGQIKHMSPEEIVEIINNKAEEQIDTRDYSEVEVFLKDDFALCNLNDWVKDKLGLKLSIDELRKKNTDEIEQYLKDKMSLKYKKREIEYPVECMMNMVYGAKDSNVYTFEALVKWANNKYNAGFSIEQIQNTNPRTLHKQLIELSESFNNGKLEDEISGKITSLNTNDLIKWANERFDTSLTENDLSGSEQQIKDKLTVVGKEFLRSELSNLERYVLVHVYDSAWKDHLYSMDHLKDSIWMSSYEQKDPKVEYKREGTYMFKRMLDAIEDHVTDMIFKIHLEVGTKARTVWDVSKTSHDEVSQFAMAERQRAAAQAPQGQTKVKQIKIDTPKVGRNDPCPCGSGKKYKKCCGKNS